MKSPDLRAFVSTDRYSTQREKMMEHWLCCKIYEACFARGVHPLLYNTEYDRGGFDLAVGVGSEFREFQLKVVVAGGKRKRWHVTSSLLCPKIDLLDEFTVLAEGRAYGRMGGVILMEVEADECVVKRVRLFYCDITMLAFRHMRQKRGDEAASRLFELFQRPLSRADHESKGKIALPKSCFIEVPSVASLLTLAGLPLVMDLADFPRQIRRSIRPILNRRRRPDGGPYWLSVKELQKMMVQALRIKK